MRKRICIIVAVPMTVRVFLGDQIKLLAKEYDVTVIANFSETPKDILDFLPLKSVQHFDIQRNISIIQDSLVLVRLAVFLKKENFDAVHSFTPKAGLIGMISAFFARINMRTHTFTGQVWAEFTGVKRVFFKFLDRIIHRLATNLLVDGHSQFAFLAKEGIITTKKAGVLGKGSISGVDINKFKSNISSKEEVRKLIGIDQSAIVFMFLGRLNEDKGVITLAKAFAKLSMANKVVHLLYVGPDEAGMENEIRSIVKDIRRVSFYGMTSEPYKFLCAGDVFCLPSYREGFGSSVIEASATGLPVICSDAYGLQDAFVPNKTGLRHQVRNADDLYNQMSKLANNNELREHMGRAGVLYVQDNFSQEEVSKMFLSFYRANLT